MTGAAGAAVAHGLVLRPLAGVRARKDALQAGARSAPDALNTGLLHRRIVADPLAASRSKQLRYRVSGRCAGTALHCSSCCCSSWLYFSSALQADCRSQLLTALLLPCTASCSLSCRRVSSSCQVSCDDGDAAGLRKLCAVHSAGAACCPAAGKTSVPFAGLPQPQSSSGSARGATAVARLLLGVVASAVRSGTDPAAMVVSV